VTILELQDVNQSDRRVRIESPFGGAVVQLASESSEVHGDCDVEFSIPERVEWGRTGIVVDERAPSIAMAQDGVRFCGALDDVQDDGVVALRLGDSLIMLESVGEPPPVGSTVCVVVGVVELYVYGN